MAIFTITNGESTELAVTKITPIIEDCFTIYEYLVTTNNNDNINIELSGNHYEAKYFDNAGNEISFSDNITLTYNTYLKIRFLLLNSGTDNVFSNATIKITNATISKFYENFVERQNDEANCYDNSEYVLRTGDTMEGTLNFNDNNINIREQFFKTCNNTTSIISLLSCGTNRGDFEIFNPSKVGTSSLNYTDSDDTWRINNSAILTDSDVDLSNYLPLTGGNMIGDVVFDENNLTNIGQVETEIVDITTSGNSWRIAEGLLTSNDLEIIKGASEYRLNATGAPVNAEDLTTKSYVDGLAGITLDSTITNGSINPVENNAIFNALALKADDNKVVKLTESNVLSDYNIFQGTLDVQQNIDYLPQSLSFKSGYGKAGFTNIINDSFFIKNPNSNNYTILDNSSLNEVSILTLPDASGTIALLSDINGSGANLTYTSSPTNGVINSDSGTDAIIPLADETNAGLISPTEKNNIVINNSKISNATHTGAVTGSTVLNITDNAVTTSKLATNSVSTVKIQNNSITTDKLNSVLASNGTYTNPTITVNTKGRVTAISNGSATSLPYLIYVARLTQTGTGAPVANVLQDTTSGITWSRSGIGEYRATPTNLAEYNRFDTIGFSNSQNGLGPQFSMGLSFDTASFIQLIAMTDNVPTDNSLDGMIEIRFY